ncbi:PEP-CTERM sorting domain-containing protein [Methylobacter psychrophilus]|uniref:PEP-CTERM sorting domain-containing protein n=1 Tax=Methylobacter psychrophilus TaxID=96941 RepID=UPI0021D48D18|nr:PEP-CTERM sorting domain-containing protein [Methylobacter psychrophilus]
MNIFTSLSKIATLSLAVLAFNVHQAQASTTLTSNINVDNTFNEYISSSATDLTSATLIQSGQDWPTTYSSANIITGATQYLIIEAVNQGGPGGFLGSFSLSGSGYQFANGTQSLLTGDSVWSQSSTINGIYTAATNEGLNGVSPWGYRSANNPNAQWIWNYYSNNSGDFNTVYFSTAISAVPVPGAVWLFASGLLGLGALRKKAQA